MNKQQLILEKIKEIASMLKETETLVVLLGSPANGGMGMVVISGTDEMAIKSTTDAIKSSPRLKSIISHALMEYAIEKTQRDSKEPSFDMVFREPEQN